MSQIPISLRRNMAISCWSHFSSRRSITDSKPILFKLSRCHIVNHASHLISLLLSTDGFFAKYFHILVIHILKLSINTAKLLFAIFLRTLSFLNFLLFFHFIQKNLHLLQMLFLPSIRLNILLNHHFRLSNFL